MLTLPDFYRLIQTKIIEIPLKTNNKLFIQRCYETLCNIYKYIKPLTKKIKLTDKEIITTEFEVNKRVIAKRSRCDAERYFRYKPEEGLFK